MLTSCAFLFVIDKKNLICRLVSHTQLQCHSSRGNQKLSERPCLFPLSPWCMAGCDVTRDLPYAEKAHIVGEREREGAWSVATRLADRSAPPPHGICQIATFLVFVKCKTLALWSEELLNYYDYDFFSGCCCCCPVTSVTFYTGAL